MMLNHKGQSVAEVRKEIERIHKGKEMSHIALSFSRLSTYEQCPSKFKAQYITKDYPDDSQNVHFIKGKRKHGQLENYIKCKNDATMIEQMYDGDVKSALGIVDKLLLGGFKIVAEQQLAVGTNWKQITWFSKQAMFRAICDFIATKDYQAILGDWKTGKFRDYDGKETGQLHLAAAVVFSLLPQITEIITAYFFIESKQTVRRRFTREMYDNGLLVPFNNSFKTVNEDKVFAPCKNQYCNWCLYKPKCELW